MRRFLKEDYDSINDFVAHTRDVRAEQAKQKIKDNPGNINVVNAWERTASGEDDEYDALRKKAVGKLQRLEKKLGRDLTDHEQMKIIKLLDICSSYSLGEYIEYSEDDLDSQSFSGRGYSQFILDLGKKEDEFLGLLARSIEYEVFDDYIDALYEKFDPDGMVLYVYANYDKICREAEEILMDVVEKSYGKAEPKEEDFPEENDE